MGSKGKQYWEWSRRICRLQPPDGNLVEAEKRPMMQMAYKLMTVTDQQDGRHRMLVAALTLAIVLIASIEPALAFGATR